LAASFTPACSIWIVSPPIAFIFEWKFDGDHAVAEIDEAGARVLLDDAVLFLRRAQDLQIRSRRLDEVLRGIASRRCEQARRSAAARRRSCACVPSAAASTSFTPIASINSNGPRSQPNPHRIARSTSSIEMRDVRS
jgi:hypothetical protein